jgi:sulfane dehydrogenase subunit SoxC
VKSFITHSVVRDGDEGNGYYEISGVAYSGNGRIARASWCPPTAAKAGRKARCRSRCCRKRSRGFRAPWRWDGGPAVLQSRAWDEAGQRAAAARRIRG